MLSAAETSRFVQETAAAAAAVRRYQAVLGVRGEGRRGRFSGRLLAVFERDGTSPSPKAVTALRLEAYGPVGGSRWTLVAGASRVRAVVRARKAFAEGSALAPFALELLGVPLGMEEVVSLLVGTGVPIPPDFSVLPGTDGQSAVLGDGDRIWWEAGPSGNLRVRRARGAGYEARYPTEGRLGDRPVPRRLEVITPPLTVRFLVEELSVNAALHPDSFVVRIPPGFRRVSVVELAGAVKLSAR